MLKSDLNFHCHSEIRGPSLHANRQLPCCLPQSAHPGCHPYPYLWAALPSRWACTCHTCTRYGFSTQLRQVAKPVEGQHHLATRHSKAQWQPMRAHNAAKGACLPLVRNSARMSRGLKSTASIHATEGLVQAPRAASCHPAGSVLSNGAWRPSVQEHAPGLWWLSTRPMCPVPL